MSSLPIRHSVTTRISIRNSAPIGKSVLLGDGVLIESFSAKNAVN